MLITNNSSIKQIDTERWTLFKLNREIFSIGRQEPVVVHETFKLGYLRDKWKKSACGGDANVETDKNGLNKEWVHQSA